MNDDDARPGQPPQDLPPQNTGDGPARQDPSRRSVPRTTAGVAGAGVVRVARHRVGRRKQRSGSRGGRGRRPRPPGPHDDRRPLRAALDGPGRHRGPRQPGRQHDRPLPRRPGRPGRGGLRPGPGQDGEGGRQGDGRRAARPRRLRQGGGRLRQPLPARGHRLRLCGHPLGAALPDGEGGDAEREARRRGVSDRDAAGGALAARRPLRAHPAPLHAAGELLLRQERDAGAPDGARGSLRGPAARRGGVQPRSARADVRPGLLRGSVAAAVAHPAAWRPLPQPRVRPGRQLHGRQPG
ncbi:hypothetical protein SMICM17S_05771 [Streptomyces microflavus]